MQSKLLELQQVRTDSGSIRKGFQCRGSPPMFTATKAKATKAGGCGYILRCGPLLGIALEIGCMSHPLQ